MNKSFYVLLLLAVIGCRKNTDSDKVLLREIRADNVIIQTFEYNDGRLAKENSYSTFCTTPVDEWVYIYQNGKLSYMETTIRSFYSSISALCNPAAGIRSEEVFEYDGQGRITKVTGDATYSVFVYNTAGLLAKQVNYLAGASTPHDSTTFSYDSRGNIIEENYTHGNIIRHYEYDNKKNPFYQIKSRPGFISAFTSSPNNVIRCTGTDINFERRILLYQHDMPFRIEQNGEYYNYTYQ